MKAIFEIEMPKSCFKCPMCRYDPYDYNQYICILSFGRHGVERMPDTRYIYESRASFCPLKPV